MKYHIGDLIEYKTTGYLPGRVSRVGVIVEIWEDKIYQCLRVEPGNVKIYPTFDYAKVLVAFQPIYEEETK